jgi:hypothetical protein
MERLCHVTVLVGHANQNIPIGCVLADAEFDSERNHTFCREQLKAESMIPAKRFTIRRSTFDSPESQKPVMKEHGHSAGRMVVRGKRNAQAIWGLPDEAETHVARKDTPDLRGVRARSAPFSPM